MPATKTRGRAKSQKQAIAELGAKVERALRWNEKQEVEALLKRYEKGLRSITTDLERFYDRYAHGGKLTYGDYLRFRMDHQVAKLAGDRLEELGVDLVRDLEKSVTDQFTEAYNRYSYVMDVTTPPNIDIDYRMPHALTIKQTLAGEWKAAMFSERIGLITRDARATIQSEFERALVQGDSAYDLGRRIRSSVGIAEDEKLVTRPLAGRAKWRADMIARTELMRGSNLAHRKVYLDNKDIVEDRTWTTRPENQYLRGRRRLCDLCLARKDKTEDEVAKIAKRQGKPLEPPIHPHCSCLWRLEPKAWKDLMTKDLAAKVKFADEYEMKYRDPSSGETMNYTPPDYEAWKKQYIDEAQN